MPYINRIISDIPKWVYCPFCNEGKYSYKTKNALLNHIKKCSEFEGDIDNIEEEEIDDNINIGDFIEQRTTMIKVSKEFIRSNELDAIKNQSFMEIFTYIKNKCGVLDGNTDFGIDWAVGEIYEFFFGSCDEVNNIMADHLKRRLFRTE